MKGFTLHVKSFFTLPVIKVWPIQTESLRALIQTTPGD